MTKTSVAFSDRTRGVAPYGAFVKQPPDPEDFIDCDPHNPLECDGLVNVPLEQMSDLLSSLLADEIQEALLVFSADELLVVLNTMEGEGELLFHSKVYVERGNIAIDINEIDVDEIASEQDMELAQELEDRFNNMMLSHCYLATEAYTDDEALSFRLKYNVPTDQCGNY